MIKIGIQVICVTILHYAITVWATLRAWAFSEGYSSTTTLETTFSYVAVYLEYVLTFPILLLFRNYSFLNMLGNSILFAVIVVIIWNQIQKIRKKKSREVPTRA